MKLYIVVILLVVGTFASAERNPLMRTCRLSGGLFWYGTTIDSANSKELSLCIFTDTAIDAQSLVQLTERSTSKAITFYLNGLDRYCRDHNISVVHIDSDTYLCEFNDGSMIDIFTLERGFGHPDNEAFDRALPKIRIGTFK